MKQNADVIKIITDDGDVFWRDSEGKLHNGHGPCVLIDGTRIWYHHGKLHREDGPAIIYSDGDLSWYVMDTRYTFDNWCLATKKTEEETVILKLKYGVIESKYKK